MIQELKDFFARWACPHCEKMHRRAQAAESRAAQVIRQNDTTRLWHTVWKLSVQRDYWRRRLRTWQQRHRDLQARYERERAQT